MNNQFNEKQSATILKSVGIKINFLDPAKSNFILTENSGESLSGDQNANEIKAVQFLFFILPLMVFSVLLIYYAPAAEWVDSRLASPFQTIYDLVVSPRTFLSLFSYTAGLFSGILSIERVYRLRRGTLNIAQSISLIAAVCGMFYILTSETTVWIVD